MQIKYVAWCEAVDEGWKLTSSRVRTLTGKEIELDIEADYKVHTHHLSTHTLGTYHAPSHVLHAARASTRRHL